VLIVSPLGNAAPEAVLIVSPLGNVAPEAVLIVSPLGNVAPEAVLIVLPEATPILPRLSFLAPASFANLLEPHPQLRLRRVRLIEARAHDTVRQELLWG
jgi:hypothetical protein